MLPDIMCMILGMLDVSSLAQLGATSRQFRDLCAAPDLWRTLLANAASCALKQQIHIRQLQSVARADVLAMLAPGWQSSCAVHVTISHSHGKHMTNEPQAHIRDSPFHTFLSSTPHASSLVSRAPLRTRLPLTQIPSTHGLAHTHTHTRWGSPGSFVVPSPHITSKKMVLADDQRTVTFTGNLLGGNRAVRCEPPLPTTTCAYLRATRPEISALTKKISGSAPLAAEVAFEVQISSVAYYEITIGGAQEDFGERDCIAVGLASELFQLTGKQPGWDRHSFGYHSDDGHVFHGKGMSSEPFGPTFRPGDTVGCGFSVASLKIFFTRNGKLIGIPFAAKAAQLPLYPVVGIDSHVPVSFNFGQQPFAFDLSLLPPLLHDTSSASAAATLKAAIRCLVPQFASAALPV